MITLDSLGISNEELLERVVDKIVDNVMHTGSSDDEGSWYGRESELSKRLKQILTERIDVAIRAALETHVLPKAEQMISAMVIQQTNSYGEPKGEPVTLTEHAVKKADEYLMMQVDYEGRDTKKPGEYGYDPKQTRLCHLVDKHIHKDIAEAVTASMKECTGVVARALHETMRIKLNEAAAALKVQVASR